MGFMIWEDGASNAVLLQPPPLTHSQQHVWLPDLDLGNKSDVTREGSFGREPLQERA
jgi:hypothetical protein